jgi:opacity protein-like surface antigen
MSSRLLEQGKTTIEVNPDDGALKYNIGALAGVSFNLSKAVFINLRYCYGLSYSYAIMGTGYKSNVITAGLGVNLIRTKNRAF